MPAPEPTPQSRLASQEISVLALASILLRWRRVLVALALVGAAIGLVKGLSSPRVYKSTAIFIPQRSEATSASSLAAAAAGQLGVRLPTSGGGWGSGVYVEVLRSRSLLERILLDTVTVVEKGGQRLALIDLLEIKGPTREQRVVTGIKVLRGMTNSREVDALSGVEVSASTRWPGVSKWLAEQLVSGVNRFNNEIRRSQAEAERQFVEAQAGAAGRALLEAEDRLQLFLERNRVISGSPELAFRKDRLEREVALRQQLYTALLQNREEARIREVRDTPVITLLEEPRLPVVGEARGTLQRATLGLLAGAMLGVFFALVAHVLSNARRAPNHEAREFFKLVDETIPGFLRRARS